MTEPLRDRPALSDYTPSADSDYAQARDRWESDFQRWARASRKEEWAWGARLRRIAESYQEWRTLRTEPLPEVAKWARAEGRGVD